LEQRYEVSGPYDLGVTMPASEIMHKFYHHQKMSNGKKITSLAQAKAIASQYGSSGEEKNPKKFTYRKKD
jgi:hypothetical protein